ncbi:MAG: GPW/gp25 family protein [Pseudomonadota bacterium]
MQGFDPTHATAGAHKACAPERHKERLGGDLEVLLNARTAFQKRVLADYPDLGEARPDFGLIDFADLCLRNGIGHKCICSAVKQTIERDQPRLHAIIAALPVRRGPASWIEFIISTRFRDHPTAGTLHFDAVPELSKQRYVLRRASLKRLGLN